MNAFYEDCCRHDGYGVPYGHRAEPPDTPPGWDDDYEFPDDDDCPIEDPMNAVGDDE